MDNLDDLHKRFKMTVTEKCADGWCYRCRVCDVAATSVEFYAPCQDDFIPEKVKCPKCGQRWKLEISLPKQDNPEKVH